jgi:hypothetical protein
MGAQLCGILRLVMPASSDLPFAQPEWNDSDSIALALQRLRDAHDEASALEAHDQFLWAVGDNHAGTYFPVVLATLAQVEQLLVDGSFWAQRAAMESLIDLCGSFVPQDESDAGLAVRDALRSAVHAMRPRLLPLATGDDARSASAAELIELIDDQAA